MNQQQRQMELFKMPSKFERTQKKRIKSKKRWNKCKTTSKMISVNTTIINNYIKYQWSND